MRIKNLKKEIASSLKNAALKSASRNDTAFTLLEVLLASIIFIISVAGIFATLSAVRQPVIDKENQLTATIFGNRVLESLRSKVSAASSANYYSDPLNCSGPGNNIICTDFSLALGNHYVTTANLPLTWPTSMQQANTVPCNVSTALCLTYTVSCADGSVPSACGADVARQVNLSINW